jgi:hypothetical protein
MIYAKKFDQLEIFEINFKNNSKVDDRQFHKRFCVFEHFPSEILNTRRYQTGRLPVTIFYYFLKHIKKSATVGKKSFCLYFYYFKYFAPTTLSNILSLADLHEESIGSENL